MDESRQLTAGMRTALRVIALTTLVTSYFALSVGDYLRTIAVATFAAALWLIALERQPKRAVTILAIMSAVLMWTVLIRDVV